jgi:hypothetical protein
MRIVAKGFGMSLTVQTGDLPTDRAIVQKARTGGEIWTLGICPRWDKQEKAVCHEFEDLLMHRAVYEKSVLLFRNEITYDTQTGNYQ